MTIGSIWRYGYKKLYNKSRNNGSERLMSCGHKLDLDCITREFVRGTTKGKKIITKINLLEVGLYR